MLSDFTFVQSTTGWIFALEKKWGVTLVALEPLPPYPYFLDQDFFQALDELHFSVQGALAFVAIGPTFAKLLAQASYSNLQIGKEPWVHLSSFQPTGKKSRGLRAAKKRALLNGIKVEQWNLNDILRKPELKKQVDALHQSWVTNTFVSLQGFLLATDPWKLTHDRICFIAFNPDRKVQGVLIATPLGRQLDWYLEDLWLGSSGVGVAELLTLEAFQKLKNLGAEKVSLGLIPLTDLGFRSLANHSNAKKPWIFASSIRILSAGVKTFYNAEGMIGFRKRFKIGHWQPAYLSVRTTNVGFYFRSLHWAHVLAAIFLAHKPKFYWQNLFKKKYKA